jgi:hypothetical protein
MSTNSESAPSRQDDEDVSMPDQPGQAPEAPRGGLHPEQPTGEAGGYTVSPGERTGAFGTRTESPPSLPDEPLPPQD